jgi:hypothetical protein
MLWPLAPREYNLSIPNRVKLLLLHYLKEIYSSVTPAFLENKMEKKLRQFLLPISRQLLLQGR